MPIKQKKVINVSGYLAAMPASTSFRVATVLSHLDVQKLTRLGFSSPPEAGETVLPKPVGPVSRFNSQGKDVVRRDLPKELRYVRTVQWRWKEWHGKDYVEKEDFRDINQMCYPRDFISPPSEEITYVASPQPMVVSRVMVNDPASHENIRQVINLFLELFGECELLDLSMATFPRPVIKRVNWQLLPPGRHPWQEVEALLAARTKQVSTKTRAVIWDRHQTIMQHGPQLIVQGRGGFHDYLAYVFEEQGVVVLDSVRYGNAVYVLGGDWETVSQLTKAEILGGQLAVARIVHSQGWKAELGSLLKG